MKKEQFYFKSLDSDICYSKEYFIEYMKEHHLQEMEVYKAVPDLVGGGIFWCKKFKVCGGDSRETCGKQCDKYEPKNKRNGVCKHHTHWLFTHGEKIMMR